MTTNDDIRRRARAVAGETSHEQRRERILEGAVKPSVDYILPPGTGTSVWVMTPWERFVAKVKGLFK